jgi:general secretion pathway protein D
MNLFNLDQMRRQQMAPPPPVTAPAPAPATNGAVQANPVPVAPSTTSPGVQP